MSSVTFGRRHLYRRDASVVARDSAAIRRPDLEATEAAPGSRSSASSAGGRWNWRLLLGIIAFPAVWLTIIFFQGPPLLRDYRLAGSFRFDPTVKIEKANCTAYWFMLKTCDIDYRRLEAPQAGLQTTRFMVAFTGTEGKFVAPMRSNIDRNAVTTQVALDLMTNRIVTFLMLVIGMGALMVAVVARLARSGGSGGDEPLAYAANLMASSSRRSGP